MIYPRGERIIILKYAAVFINPILMSVRIFIVRPVGPTTSESELVYLVRRQGNPAKSIAGR